MGSTKNYQTRYVIECSIKGAGKDRAASGNDRHDTWIFQQTGLQMQEALCDCAEVKYHLDHDLVGMLPITVFATKESCNA